MKLPVNTLLLTLLCIAVAASVCPALDLKLTVEPDRIYQGGIAFITINSKDLQSASLEQNNQKVAFYAGPSAGMLSALIGIDLSEEPGEKKLPGSLTFKNGRQQSTSIRFTVLKKNFPTQKLTLPASKVTLSLKNEARAAREQEKVLKLFTSGSPNRLWSGPFIQPLEGTTSTAFGLRRLINGSLKNPHTGIDLKAPSGMPVAASAGGIVACTGEHFFSGNSIFIDHGAGLFTMYFHLAEIKVKQGQRVAPGEIIGTVGSTGRSTGPHLHWGVRVNNQRVDPLALVALFRFRR